MHTVDAHGDGTSAMQPSTAQQADTASASRKTDSCSIRAALQNKQAAIRFKPPLAKLTKRMERRASLAAEPGPSGWRNVDIAAKGRGEGGPAVPRHWIGIWTQGVVLPKTSRRWTAATFAPFGLWAREI